VIARDTSTSDDLREALAVIAAGKSSRKRGYVRAPTESLGTPPFDDAFMDRCRLAFSKLAGLADQGVVAVTSARRGDGRSSVAAALAAALARTRGLGGVLLLDLDFENPAQARLFAVSSTPGLAEFLEGGKRLRLVFGGPGRQLALAPAGKPLGAPAQLLHRLSHEWLLSIFRERFQWVVVDLPPLDMNPEVAGLAYQADWHIIVGRHRHTTVNDLRLVQEHVVVTDRVGFLLTGDSTRIPRWIRRLI
jgi:Mrp family chromosome partitioning ATPase